MDILKDILQEKKDSVSWFNSNEFEQAVYDAITHNQKKTRRSKKKSFSPSTLAQDHGKCPRYWYLAFTGGDFNNEHSPQTEVAFRVGQDRHSHLQQAMKEAGMMLHDEVELRSEDPPILAFADGIVMWNNEMVVVEIKTTRHEGLKYREERGNPTRKHEEQLILYMKLLRYAHGIVLYESKNTHELVAVPVDVTPKNKKWADDAFEWMRSVYAAWSTGHVLKRGYRKGSKVCQQCPLQAMCDEYDPGDTKIPRLEPLK